ncbi:MAG: DUF2851 family protein [Taibaiella sp.]|nr:DUF2851 family protein [Taibaiella sp.]
MNEAFLQYIWQYALFQPDQLQDTAGRSLLIIHPGRLNKDEGPDFSNARIRIDGVEWIGNIEIHIRSSDWKRHHHEHHPLYQNIILHVVWENEGLPSWGNFSTLEIRPFVRQEILEKYGKLFFFVFPDSLYLHAAPGAGYQDKGLVRKPFDPKVAAEKQRTGKVSLYLWSTTGAACCI